jgi:hypothetical protein
MGSRPEWASRTEPAVGERWVYRRGENEELAEVEVLRIGVRKPARLLVRFVSDEFEGLQDWVPPSRLKALWRDVAEYTAWSTRWRALMRDSPDHDSHLLRAAQIAVGEVLPESVVEIGWNYTLGVSFIHDVSALAGALNVPSDTFLDDERVFTEGTTFVAPWPTTLAIAQMAASRQPRAILRWIEIDEARARREAIHGRFSRPGARYDSWAISGEDAASIDAEHSAPVRDLLRQWIGADHVDQSADLEAAREDARRLSALASAALETLRSLGHKRQATLLEHKFAEEGSSSFERRPPRARQSGGRASRSGDQAEAFALPRTAPKSPPAREDQPMSQPTGFLDGSD